MPFTIRVVLLAGTFGMANGWASGAANGYQLAAGKTRATNQLALKCFNEHEGYGRGKHSLNGDWNSANSDSLARRRSIPSTTTHSGAPMRGTLMALEPARPLGRMRNDCENGQPAGRPSNPCVSFVPA